MGKNIPHLKVRISKKGTLILDRGLLVHENFILEVSVSGKLYIGRNVFVNDNSATNSRNEIYIGDGTAIGVGSLINDFVHENSIFYNKRLI